MRDIFVMLVVFGALPFILARPYVGIYVWSWLGYMNPHRLSWGFATTFPFAQIVGIATLLALLCSSEPKRIPWRRETIVLLLFIGWMLVTTLCAVHQDAAWLHMQKIAKIQLMIFLTLILINDAKKLNWLVWSIALSLGFYGVKGGIFTLLHGGNHQVRGPLGTFIGGNNEIALALIMTIPLMRYLQLSAKKVWVRHGLTAAMILTSVAIIGSHSRGGLVGAAAMGTFLWVKSRKKIATAVLIGIATTLVLTVMPEKWHARMSTIETYQTDGSAQGRLNAWGFALNLAKSRPLVGGGFETFTRDLFAVYAPDPTNVHDAHSIYFEVLGEHGFVGLSLFLLLGLFTWRTASQVIKRAKGDPDKKWASDLAAMVQVSMVGYGSAGAFLGLAYFDLYYHIVAIGVLTAVIALKEPVPQPAVDTKPPLRRIKGGLTPVPLVNGTAAKPR